MERYLKVRFEDNVIIGEMVWSEHILSWEGLDHYWVRSNEYEIGDTYVPPTE